MSVTGGDRLKGGNQGKSKSKNGQTSANAKNEESKTASGGSGNNDKNSKNSKNSNESEFRKGIVMETCRSEVDAEQLNQLIKNWLDALGSHPAALRTSYCSKALRSLSAYLVRVV